jgi:hypothetical protein
MARRTIKSLSFVIVLITISIILAGCSDGPGNRLPAVSGVSYPVDPDFKEFYELLGGQPVLGPAITKMEDHTNNVKCQLTERAMMCYNLEKTGTQRYYLDALGLQFKIHPDQGIAGRVAPAGSLVVNGLVIYEKFVPLYEKLYGAQYVGEPLTELRINYDLNRVEQFFTNVGFYQSLDDPNGPVFLIPYGAYVCGGTCQYSTTDYWRTMKSNLVEQPFAESIIRIGGSSVVGTPELQPELTADGLLRQVYSNVIIQAPHDNLSDISLYPVSAELGYVQDPLEDRQIHDQLVFVMIDPASGKGFNVPVPFEKYLAVHGGMIMAGKPIQPVKKLADQDLYQQCFENLCMIYDPSASESLKVRFAPLGKAYVKQNSYKPELQITNYFSPDQINLFVSVDRANLSSNDEQYFRIVVEEVNSMQGIANVEGAVVLSIENRDPIRIYFPPTDANGMTVAVVPPQPDLANNTRVQYEVCLNLPSDRPICRQDSYLIWNTR